MLSTCSIGFQATDVDIEIADMKVDSTPSTSGAFNSAYLKAADMMSKVWIEEPDERCKENIQKKVCKTQIQLLILN